MRLNNYYLIVSMEIMSMNIENSKKDKPLRFILDLPPSLDLRTIIKSVALQNLSIYYTWKNRR